MMDPDDVTFIFYVIMFTVMAIILIVCIKFIVSKKNKCLALASQSTGAFVTTTTAQHQHIYTVPTMQAQNHSHQQQTDGRFLNVTSMQMVQLPPQLDVQQKREPLGADDPPSYDEVSRQRCERVFK